RRCPECSACLRGTRASVRRRRAYGRTCSLQTRRTTCGAKSRPGRPGCRESPSLPDRALCDEVRLVEEARPYPAAMRTSIDSTRTTITLSIVPPTEPHCQESRPAEPEQPVRSWHVATP